MHMLEHIVVHSLQVCRVGMGLVDFLSVKGIDLDGPLLQAAALLHDITKTRSFKTEENHALTGGRHLTDAGFSEVGDLVRQHVRLDDYSEPQILTEAQVINYADKRVLHDRIVSLEKRFEDLLLRYGRGEGSVDLIRSALERAKQVERRVFQGLSIRPEKLASCLRGVPRR